MGLNIKNETTHRLIRELAELTGESQTAAVTTAVQERLERLRRVEAPGSLSARLLAIGKDCAMRLGPVDPSVDPTDFLYGEDGLPR
ncbi:MAG TPA: type II toxin-antitoxin system VapB family antitoxin [Xanthobacteraceae bacterium]|nr:type II toxin-antitoxin system VapB family antitoxin [Xanthobacteraceae bacterium]